MLQRFLVDRPRSPLGLVIAPYLILLGLLLLTSLLFAIDATVANAVWSIFHWLIRLVFIGGTYWGWHVTARGQRPLWWYSWLGFATYELVALLLIGVYQLMLYVPALTSSWVPLGLLLGALAFLPYFIVAIRVAQTDRQLALFTILPQAALTVPLFLLALARVILPELDQQILHALTVPLLVATLLVAILHWQQRERSWGGLYGSMAASQSAFTLSIAWSEHVPLLAFATLPLVILGAFILTGPLLLLPLWHRVMPLLKRLGGEKLFHHWQAGAHAVHNRRAVALSSQPVPVQAAVPALANPHSGGSVMTELTTTPPAANPLPNPTVGPNLERLYKVAVVILAAVIIGGIILFVGRSAIYKIHEYERGLHLRGGRFLAEQEPGWHLQIPLVDTVIIVKVNERLGYVERIEAMTSDNVTMFVSLQYTYRVTNPQQYALQVDDPERIVFEFVQGRLRDVVNTKAMAAVMNERALMNEEVMTALQEKEGQYGVQFVTVQMQSASPPDEVLSAIKDRMVATQRQEQAQAEAAQQKTVADAELYTAQKRAEAAAYEITKKAEADAQRIRLTTEAQQLSIRSVLAELDGKGELANKFIDYLIAQQLKDNSKWIINGEGTPIVDLK